MLQCGCRRDTPENKGDGGSSWGKKGVCVCVSKGLWRQESLSFQIENKLHSPKAVRDRFERESKINVFSMKE